MKNLNLYLETDWPRMLWSMYIVINHIYVPCVYHLDFIYLLWGTLVQHQCMYSSICCIHCETMNLYCAIFHNVFLPMFLFIKGKRSDYQFLCHSAWSPKPVNSGRNPAVINGNSSQVNVYRTAALKSSTRLYCSFSLWFCGQMPINVRQAYLMQFLAALTNFNKCPCLPNGHDKEWPEFLFSMWLNSITKLRMQKWLNKCCWGTQLASVTDSDPVFIPHQYVGQRELFSS